MYLPEIGVIIKPQSRENENKIPKQNQRKGDNTMKKTNKIKTRIIAGLLSTVTAFSVGVIAISSASAAEINSSEYILQQNHIQDNDQL